MGTIDELLQRISDAASRDNDASILSKVTLSTVEWVRMRIHADGGHVENSLDWTL